jgi:hypothetical protein
MPPARWLGGLAFSVATSVAVGIRVSDSQCGYAAISREACVALDLDALWPRYGYPNDLLSQLALRGMRIAEAPVRAVYADEVSRLKVRHVPVIAAIVARAGWRRLGTAVPKTSPPPRSDPSRLTAAPQVPARGSRVHAPARDRD